MERRQARGSLGVRGARHGRRGRGCGAGRRWQPVLPSRAQHPGVLPDREMARGWWRRGDRSARSCGRMQLRPLGDSGRGLQVEPPFLPPQPCPGNIWERRERETREETSWNPKLFHGCFPIAQRGVLASCKPTSRCKSRSAQPQECCTCPAPRLQPAAVSSGVLPALQTFHTPNVHSFCQERSLIPCHTIYLLTIPTLQYIYHRSQVPLRAIFFFFQLSSLCWRLQAPWS